MGLSSASVVANIPVEDVARAREFYEGKLGLEGGIEQGDGGTSYPCDAGTMIHVYPSPGHAGQSGATLAAWVVDDTDAAVDELAANGVEFEQYDTDQIRTNEKGIADLGEIRGAWFRDPDGNILGVFQT